MRKSASNITLLAGSSFLLVVCLMAAPPVLLDEGFEAGSMPPIGWWQEILDSSYTWEISNTGAHSGAYSARVGPEPNSFKPQNEWLIGPEVLLDEASLVFWSKGDLYWCRDLFDHCDLLVWLVVGDLGGGDDVFVGKADDDWLDSGAWSRSGIDLAPYLSSPPTRARLGFEYIGWDARGSISLDDIEVTAMPLGIFSDGFELGDLSSWSSTVP